MPLSLAADDDGHAAAVRRHRGRLGQRAVPLLPDFGRLSVLDPPQPIARSAGGQIEQRCPAEARGQRPRRRPAAVGLRVAIVGVPIEQRHAPQAGGGVGDGGDDAAAVATGRHRRILPEPRAHPSCDLALDVERPQPRARPVLRARHVEQRARVERRHEIHGGVLLGQSLRRSARGANAPHVHLVGLAPVRARSRSTGRLATRPDCGSVQPFRPAKICAASAPVPICDEERIIRPCY